MRFEVEFIMLKSLLSKPVASARKFAPKKKVEDKTAASLVNDSSSASKQDSIDKTFVSKVADKEDINQISLHSVPIVVEDKGAIESLNETAIVTDAPAPEEVCVLPPPPAPNAVKRIFGTIHTGSKKPSAVGRGSGGIRSKSTDRYLKSTLERDGDVPYANASILPSKMYGDNCPHELITVYLRKQPVDVSFISFLYLGPVRSLCRCIICNN